MNEKNTHENSHQKDVKRKGTPPRHWVELEELEKNYWDRPEKQAQRSQEFLHKPIETLEKLEKADKKGIARRDFLGIMGASMAFASLSCARRPVNKIIPYVVKPEEVLPGVSTWYASTCRVCSAGCGILTKNREGRPIKLEGNPDHPMNQGALCVRCQASLLDLYDPERLQSPVKNIGQNPGQEGEAVPAAWMEVDAAIQKKLNEAQKNKKAVRLLSLPQTGPATRDLTNRFLRQFSNAEWVEYSPLANESLCEAQKISYGGPARVDYRFNQADVVVSLGADFLGTWCGSVENAREWSQKRKVSSRSSQMSKLYCFEPHFSITGSNADERFAVKPGDELRIAFFLAQKMIQRGFQAPARFKTMVSSYTAERVAEQVGGNVTAEKLEHMASNLWKARGKSILIAGGIHSQTEEALSLQLVVNWLNHGLGNEGKTVVGGTGLVGNQNVRFERFRNLINEMNDGKVEVLILHRVNPVYWLSEIFEQAMKKVSTVIAVADRVDETAQFAHWVLPDHHYLESWGDSESKSGVFAIQQPAIRPLFSTRSVEESFLKWMKQTVSWHDYLKSYWQQKFYPRFARGRSFEVFWEDLLKKGVLEDSSQRSSYARSFQMSSLSRVNEPALKKDYLLSLYEKAHIHDGRQANNAWLQELPDPITSITWDNYLNVAPSTAKKLKLREHDVVWVEANGKRLELPVHIQPGVHPHVFSVAVGYGRKRAGHVGNQAGWDVFPFVKMTSEQLVFSGQEVKIARTGKRFELATTQGHFKTENRPIVNDVSLNDFQKNPKVENHTNPHLRMNPVPSIWPEFEYKGYRWGMAIDLNACTGCSACVVACQAENNIPVVGRDRVRVSREMHWIRVDRYFTHAYSGTPDYPDVVFQPMLCQHCENAPCEVVCPVLATTHSDEGLNQMTYSRCVGTRYCQNNCPYKVRRFNFFDHWKDYKKTQNLVFNPDVTLRSRGIMEKCTFCVQRINEAKWRAKDEKRKVEDGELKTACQQTCPTDAIVFGDINDPNARVSKLRKQVHAFNVLEAYATKPSVSYLTKVRNKEEAKKEGSKDHGHH